MGNKRNATKSSEAIIENTNKAVDSAVKTTTFELKSATDLLTKETKEAVNEITVATDSLGEDLQQLDEVSKSLENNVLYSEILVKAEYFFPPDKFNRDYVGGKMVEVFAANKLYILEFATETNTAAFKSNSSNEFFWVPPDMGGYGINTMFTSSVHWNSGNNLRINYLLSSNNLEFDLEKLHKGDEFNFHLWTPSSLSSSNVFDLVEVELEIKLKNGRIIDCEIIDKRPFGGLGYLTGVVLKGKVSRIN